MINESMPIVDARLENGSRVNAVIYPVALNGPILTIRRFPEHPITMEKLIALGSITQECAEFLEKLVKARYSMVIGGGTGSGKTTFLAAMSEYIPRDERLITIEIMQNFASGELTIWSGWKQRWQTWKEQFPLRSEI